MNQLVNYETACRALAAAKTFPEIHAVRETSEAMRAYAKMAKNRDAEADATEIRIRAERRLGEMLKAQKSIFGMNKGGRGQLKGRVKRGSPLVAQDADPRPTLKQLGISKKLSGHAQKLASVEKKQFEKNLASWRDAFMSRPVSVNPHARKNRRPSKGEAISAQEQPADFRLIDGKILGDVGLSDLKRLAELRASEARLLLAIYGHFAAIDPDLNVRDGVRADTLKDMIADAFRVRS